MAENIDKLLNEIQIQFDASDKRLKSLQPFTFEIPDDVNAIENAYSTVQHFSEELARDMRERVAIVDKNELVTVLLNYKVYEIRYDFGYTVEQLREERKRLEALGVTQETSSQAAFDMVEIDNKIAQCEESYQQQHSTIKEQILRTQIGYENSITVLDACLDRLKKNLNYLSLLTEALKAHSFDQDAVGEKAGLRPLETTVDHFTELQTSGWKTRTNLTTPEAKGLKITEDGMLVTDSGRLITYLEAREHNLLDNLRVSDFLKIPKEDKEDFASVRSESATSSSAKSRMSSEDVAYLIEHLGTPLTLALAEITALQPRDPIHYLGHWLFKYLYNREVGDIESAELNLLTEERTRLAKEKWHKFVEEEAKAAVFDMIARAEEEAIHAELLRIERELVEQEQEEEILDDEARDKFGAYDENEGFKL